MKTIGYLSKPRTQKGVDTRNRILFAAAECISNLGIEKTSITAIANRARVPRSLVARYIPKKTDLLVNIIEFWKSQGIVQTTPSLPPLEQEIEAHVETTRYLELNPQFASCVILVYYYSSIDPRMAAYCREFSDGAEQRSIKFLIEEDKIRKTKIPENLLVSFGVQLANMSSMHLLKRFTTPIKNKRQYDDDYIRTVRHLWEAFFAAAVSV